MSLLVAVSLLSAAAVAYEILLTRLFNITLWHHFAYMVISLALLGYGASGTFLVLVRHRLQARFGVSFAALAVSFGLAGIGCYALAWRLPFNPLEVIWDWRQQFYLAAMYLLLALPFFAAGSAIGLSSPLGRPRSMPSIAPISRVPARARSVSCWSCSHCHPRIACVSSPPSRSLELRSLWSVMAGNVRPWRSRSSLCRPHWLGRQHGSNRCPRRIKDSAWR